MSIEYAANPLNLEQVEEIYSSLSKKIYDDMDQQFKQGKINGATYAQTWAQLMQSVISGSLSTVAQLQMKETEADRCIKEAQCDLTKSQKEKVDYEVANIMPSTLALNERQLKGFDDNLRQKLFESQMNSWAMMFSSGLLEEVPNIITNQEVATLYEDILEDILGEQRLPVFSVAITATEPSGTTTVSWGHVAGADTYVLYASTTEGSIAGYPTTVNADSSTTVTVANPPSDETEVYTFRVVASAVGKTPRASTTQLIVEG